MSLSESGSTAAGFVGDSELSSSEFSSSLCSSGSSKPARKMAGQEAGSSRSTPC